MVLKPSFAMIWRNSSATKYMKLITCSGVPLKFLRNSGSCVAIPTGQVFKWHFLIIIQPEETNGAVAKPNSSAPSKQAIATSRPVFSCPSHSKTILLLKLFKTNVCCASASPNSQGNPACFNEVSGEAPVPPSKPEIRITSAFALATPAAIVPTPTSETNFTFILASLFAFFKSYIN